MFTHGTLEVVALNIQHKAGAHLAFRAPVGKEALNLQKTHKTPTKRNK